MNLICRMTINLSKIYPVLFLFFYCAEIKAQADATKNIIYAEVGGRKLLLDLYKPVNVHNPHILVWVHGGAWRSGSKEDPPLGLLSTGYAIASLDFRLSTEAPFPAQIYDIKAAIRFLRGNAKKYGYTADKIVIAGSSSGGHLVALTGTTNNDSYYEGSEGNFLKESSAVQGIIDFYGPTNFLTILTQSTPHGISVRAPALEILLGKPLEQVPDLAKKASPVFQIDASDPPILIIHGDQDNQVPINQSLELMAAYKKAGLSWQLEIVPGAGHGDSIYYTKEFQRLLENFLSGVLK
jgi:acetyl esterase/lipase